MSGEFPDWFYRVNRLTYRSDDRIKPEYFDEDLSELESDDDSTKESAVASECDCGSDDECEHQLEDEEDTESEMTYYGSEADWYYELKEHRDARKRQLRDEKRVLQEEMEYESAKADEVCEASEALRNAEEEGETLHMEPVVDKLFRLYSPDYVEHTWADMPNPIHIEFRPGDNDENAHGQEASKKDKWTVEARLHLHIDFSYDFLPFRSPTRPSLRKEHVLKSWDGKYKAVLVFISDEYLELKVNRNLAFRSRYGHLDIPETALETYHFKGIVEGREKEKEEHRERRRLEEEREVRSPSPRDTWFENNHPMGHWNDRGSGKYW